MIGFVQDISNQFKSDSNIGIVPVSNFDYIDTSSCLNSAREKIQFLIPEFIRYISGDRTKSKIYGKIKRYYLDEVLYISENISSGTNTGEDIEDSCSIYNNLRVIVINKDAILSSISGYDVISFMKNTLYINTVFIQDMNLTTDMAFDICLKLFDNIITKELSEDKNINVLSSKCIPLYYDQLMVYKLSRFIVDYFVELLYPFYKNISINSKELEKIIYSINTRNFDIISEDMLNNIYNYIRFNIKGVAEDNSYEDLILKYAEELKAKYSKSEFNI